ncbi:MAG: peptide chain release factor-like protein [Phycisphaerae bacterium]|nr:peptide chain release factor-like protein [Phycisphaerae bacterium]
MASDAPRLSAADARARSAWPVERLLAECEADFYRASGPGGQKRNKTSSAVRLRHKPSGTIVIAEESRSQHENKACAVERLRLALVLEHRLPLPSPLVWPMANAGATDRLRVNEKNPAYLDVLGLVLDALHAASGKPSAAGELLDVSGSSLTRFLARNPRAWAAAQQLRAQFGLGPLQA